MKTFKISVIVFLISICFSNQFVIAQCYVNAGNNKNALCGDSVQLNGSISSFIPWTSPTTTDLSSVYLTDETHGWAVGRNGTILKFDGINWVNSSSPTSQNLLDIYMIDSTNGWACGEGTAILKYDGSNWTVGATLNGAGSAFSICFSSPYTGWLGTYNHGLYKYNGNNWSSHPCPISHIEDIFFIDSIHGWAVGDGAIIKYNGNVWEIDTTLPGYLQSVHFTDTMHGWAVGGNGGNSNVIYQYDGTTWNFINKPGYLTFLNTVFFTDSLNGWMMGGYGTILNYSNSSLDFVPSPNGSTISSLFFADQNSGWAVGENGAILKYNNYDCYWTPSIGLNDTTILNPNCSPVDTTTYVLHAIFSDGCSATDSVIVIIKKHLPPNLCIVSYDSISNKNLIIWEKPQNIPVDTFNIYKETNVSGVFSIIGKISFDSISEFIDINSAPLIKSASYKLSFEDSCGIETDLSPFHKTMHLNINQGMGSSWNLIWNDYEGFAVTSYDIYRGTQPNNFTLINTTTSGNTSFTDFSAPSGYVYYQIEVLCPNLCANSKENKSFLTSKSNIATNNPITSIYYNLKKELFQVYPNPAKDIVRIDGAFGSTLKLMDITGRLVLEQVNTDGYINISTLAKGSYILEMTSDSGLTKAKLFKE